MSSNHLLFCQSLYLCMCNLSYSLVPPSAAYLHYYFFGILFDDSSLSDPNKMHVSLFIKVILVDL